jgi:hypothetical protein
MDGITSDKVRASRNCERTRRACSERAAHPELQIAMDASAKAATDRIDTCVGLTVALTRAGCGARARGRCRVQRLVGQRGWRYSTPVRLAIELPPAQADRLRAEAERLGLSAEELARAALNDLLSAPDPEFQDAARRVVCKNQDLYKRLA